MTVFTGKFLTLCWFTNVDIFFIAVFFLSRAVVERKPNKADDKYEVRFIDFGNPEAGLTNAAMVYLPDDLAEVMLFQNLH